METLQQSKIVAEPCSGMWRLVDGEEKNEELKERKEESPRRRLPCLQICATLITKGRQREVKH